MNITIENEYAQYIIGSDGTNLHFIDKRTDMDYCVQKPESSFAHVRKAGKVFNVSESSYADGRITARFGESGVSAVIGVTAKERYFVFEVLSVAGEQVEELVFLDLSLAVKGTPEEPFAGCALALNLQTNVPELPRANSRLRAMCYPRFGFAGAKVALIGCPQSELRQVMQEVVSAAGDLPHSSIGGPWALDAAINKGSYLFNFGDLSEEKVDDWIRLAQSLGINQIDFHGGSSFRFGDCRPNPKTYPRGLASLRAVTDKLHNAGIMAGLHTYAFFIDKSCPWVTPVPDPRLAKDATFTLAEPLTTEADQAPVVESTQNMSAITGFFVRNSVTLQIDDELITYSNVSKEPPYAFTNCKRGAYGTQATSHAKGAQVHHLKECFGLFVPDGDSTLFSEVAARTAEAFNEGGFDMMYMDALDGEDIVGGPENGWHYGSKFVFEIWKHLKKPAVMEMSTFHHHLWYVRSRLGAWDHPTRSHKKFIDIHCAANEECRRMFLPAHLGWWAFKTWSGQQGEPTFADDIEYLCCKCLGTDTGLSIMGIDPYNISNIPALPGFAAIMKRYENLRHSNYFPESVKAKLRVPGDEFTLIQGSEGEWQLRPIQYAKHKVEGGFPPLGGQEGGFNGWSNIWQTHNKFGKQPLQLRIEALMSAGPYDDPENMTLADFSDPEDFPDRATEAGITANLQSSKGQVKVVPVSGCYTASSKLENRRGMWAKVGKIFSPPLDLSRQQGMGVWVYGDGQEEVLNFQVRSPEHLVGGIGEHYVIVNFTGWRYFELIEPEGQRHADYSWPYGNIYSIYRESVNYSQVETLSLWYNNIPANKTVTCYLSPIRALPLIKAKLRHPAVTIGDKTIVFPVEIESGCYLEFHSMSDCKLYGTKGELICEVKLQGDVPLLEAGENQVKFTCLPVFASSTVYFVNHRCTQTGDVPAELNARANVIVISQSESLLDGTP
jgi:hypothetical protein